ncbi:MAG: DUF4440 domain-containing protein [bacterium]|nr:DUF4440 domain-containing protein [bacterium]
MDHESALRRLTQELLDCIASGDWEKYCQLCDPSLTCFEPEAVGNLVQGLDFHRFYFDLLKDQQHQSQTTITQPHVRVMGQVAVVAYVRLIQKCGPPEMKPALTTEAYEETRIWRLEADRWIHVHFHRSPARTWEP